jgi:lysophospholipase L1-like esterase
LQTASPVICTNVANQCIVFDFNGVMKRRLVRVNSWGGTCNPSLTGVAMSVSGILEVTDSPNDQMLLLGDSVLNTISTPGSVVPISHVGALLKRALGLSGTINCSVGGSGYIAANANTFNVLNVLSNPVNQVLLPGYKPGHVLIAAGYNDIGAYTPAAVAAAALATWQAARAMFPNAKITITDGFSEATGPSANALAQAAALLAQFSAWADSNSRFIQSTSAAASTAWLQGVANAGSAIAAGNTCNFVGTDGTHPTLLGAYYQGAIRLPAAISSAWNGNY